MPPPVTARVLRVVPRTVTLSQNYPALLRGYRKVRVVARVNGVLESRDYKEGARVEQGATLFRIEKDVYSAEVDQRKANLASAKASKENATSAFKRTKHLYKSTKGGAASKSQYQNARAKLRSAKAAVRQARAALKQAKIDLDYTDVTAPISGRISLRDIDVGNLVQPGDKLATITALNPIEARFALTVEDAALLRRQRRDKNASPVRVIAHSALRSESLRGRIDYLASTIDPQTSTVEARATFENPERLFLPGEYVQVRLEGLEKPDVLAVPQIAVTQGQGGSELYVLDKNNRARTQNVELGQTFEPAGSSAFSVIVTHGLSAGARVVVNHIDSIKAGARIKAGSSGSGNAKRGRTNQDSARK
jgi:membrane fusion protein (multidrug efflux system)